MVRHRILQAKAAEPPIGQVQMHFLTESAFGADAIAVADNQHPNHQFGIDGWAAGMAVVIGQLLAQVAQIKALIDAAQQMILGNVVFKIEAVEQPALV